MKRPCLLFFVIMFVVSVAFVQGQTYTYYGAHVTDQAPWINKIVVYNNGGQDADFQITVWDTDGQVFLQEEYTAPAYDSLTLVMSNFAGYVPLADEVDLTPVEGTFMIETQSEKLRPKYTARYGDSLSLTEFFLQETMAWKYILPNTIQEHFSWTGVAVMNPHDESLSISLKAYLGGLLQGVMETIIAPHSKFVSLSDWIWDQVGYTQFDQIKISSSQQPFPTPESITGNNDQDRHVFFNGAVTAPEQPDLEPGDLFSIDPIVGNLRYVPAGSFTQGSLPSEPCRTEDETQFEHTLTRNLAVMETEVTRQMWADLKAAQPSLPADPTNETYGAGMDHPVNSTIWFEAVLFANLLSQEAGLTPCYYKDASFNTLVDSTNYTTGDFFCDFDADGYRLPFEGEWEFFCRAGTSSVFWVDEPNYNAGTCGDESCTEGTLPSLEAVAWFCANRYAPEGNGTTKPAGLKPANPWGLRDIYGNILEFCWDYYSEAYPDGSTTDYTGPSNGSNRAVRSSSFGYDAANCRSAERRSLTPGVRYNVTGTRLVRTINE